MGTTVQVLRAQVNPANVTWLLHIKPRAIAQAQSVCAALLRAELIHWTKRPGRTC